MTPILPYSITPLLHYSPTPCRLLQRYGAAVAGDGGPLAGQKLEDLLRRSVVLGRDGKRHDDAGTSLIALDLPVVSSEPPLFQVADDHVRVALHGVPERALVIAEHG